MSGHRTRLAAVALLCLTALLAFSPSSGRASASGQTIVSLTFDDGRATAYTARSTLASYGMHATFFVNSPRLGSSSFYMSWQQVQNLYADGDEIGGHDAYHADLTAVSATEAQRQICDDRVNLLNHGIQASDFAYPYGAYNASIETLAKNCGYNSARTTDQAPAAGETMPPRDPYAIRQASGSGSLSALESAVSAVEAAGGGWAPITFHDICSDCSSVSISQSDFSSFLGWLQGQQANGVVVETVGQVIGGSLQPPVQGPAPPPAPGGTNTIPNSSLELDSNADKAPDCFAFDNSGSNSYTWTRTTDAHAGSYAERVDVSNYTSGDNKLLLQEDLGSCSPTVTPGHQYRLTTWYKADSPVNFTVFARDSQWAFTYWTSSPTFPAASSWTQASWLTPVIPNTINGLAFGLTINSNGYLQVDDVGITDAATGGADTTAPSVSLNTPASGSTLAGFVSLTASAADNVALDHLDFLVDGTVVGSAINGPLAYSWNSRTVANGSHTLAARAVDTSGNLTTTPAITITVSNQTTNLLQNPSLESASGSTPSCWLPGGYGTNSYSWTRTPDAHTGSYAETLTISAYTSGDRKLVNIQDSGSCAPAGIPGHTYTVSGWYKSASGSQPYVFAYYRSSSGAWTLWGQSAKLPASSSWKQASWATPALPAGATNVSVGLGIAGVGQLTMDDFTLTDNAPAPDATPPSSTIACNDSTDSEGSCGLYYDMPPTIILRATDNLGGSGVAQIRYTTDGSVPTLSNGTSYSGPFDSSTTVKFRAYDNAGNAEAVNTQPILIDTAAPTTTASCNGAACASGWYSKAVSLSLLASDSGGSGVRTIYYTTDGSDPSSSNGNVALGAFSLPATATVKFRAYDNAGNAEAVKSQFVQIDTDAPASTISCNGGACAASSYNAAVAVTLLTTDAGSGVAQVRYTTDGSDPSATSGSLYAGPFWVAATATVKFRAFDNAGNAEPVNSQLIQVSTDTTPPSSTIACNGASCSASAYSSPVTISLSATDEVGGSGVAEIFYTTDGSDPSQLHGASYLSPFSVSATATIKYRAYDNAGNAEAVESRLIQVETAPAAVNLLTPLTGATVSGTIGLTASTSGGIAVDHVSYAVDGSPLAGSASVGPYLVSFDTATVADGPHTIVARAFDAAGNETDSQPVSVSVQNARPDTTPPSSTIACNGASCSASTYSSPVTISLNATDEVGGSGVAEIFYTTDGSDPSQLHGASYLSPFSVPATATIKYRAYDNAGNAEAVESQLVQVSSPPPPDTTAPTSSIACNAGSCSGWFNGAVSARLSATDNTGGSGVAQIRYTTDGTTPTLTNGIVSGGAFSIVTTTTVKFRAWDNAGNVEPLNTQLVQIDTQAPTSTIACNSGSCGTSYYTAAVSVGLNATDKGGSTVAMIVYTTDGSDPSLANGSTYSGPFSLAATTAVKFRAYDNAGNTEPVNSALVKVDTTPPATSAGCNGGSCGGTWFQPGLSVALTATDADSGVAQIRYTTDGTTPTATSGIIFTAPFVVSQTTTVKFRALDNVGNLEQVESQTVQVDGTAPGVQLTSPAAGAALSGPVALAASATDNAVVARVDFLVDGNVVASASSSPYSASWDSTSVPDGSHSIAARATDLAGNQTISSAVSVTVGNRNLLQNPSLEQASGSTPSCWLLGGYGTNSYSWTRSSDAHTGSFGETLQITAYTSGDRKFVSAQDAGSCAPAVSPGSTYTITAWYKASVQPFIYVYYRSSSGAWTFWVNSPRLPVAASWSQASFVTPAVPAGATNISVGLGISTVGSLTMDDFGLFGH